MGDRSSIIISSKHFDSSIRLYGHYSGNQNIEAVKDVMEMGDVRIGDPSYLTAQLFYRFSQLGGYQGKLGFGIDAYDDHGEGLDDNPPVYVDADSGDWRIGL